MTTPRPTRLALEFDEDPARIAGRLLAPRMRATRTREGVGGRALAVALCLLAFAATPAWADSQPGPSYPGPCGSALPRYTGDSPRVQRITVDGHYAIVVLPSDYSATNRRYPVLYLLHGAISLPDEWLARMDTLSFTAGQHVLMVLPDDGPIGGYSDWRDGSHDYETAHIRQLIPYVDAHYRTIANRAYRAVAGFSLGGFGAMHYAARHPDLFVAAASFSGALDVASPVFQSPYFYTLGAAANACITSNVEDPNGIWGEPHTSEIWWRDANPTDLAGNLRGMSLYAAVGNGAPCSSDDSADVAADAPDPTPLTVETEFLHETARFVSALGEHAIPVTYRPRSCGIHTDPYWQTDLHEWWPIMIHAFGTPAPHGFDYRSALGTISVWDWRVTVDPRRAPEFLDITAASASGATFTGSGTETVVTARYFRPHQMIELQGAIEPSARAGSSGRVRFHINLGAPHQDQQYTPGADAAQATDPGYRHTQHVTFATAP